MPAPISTISNHLGALAVAPARARVLFIAAYSSEKRSSADLLVAQGLVVTKSMRISPGGFIPPYHHRAELAHRIVWLDHISRGRCHAVVGSSAIQTDWWTPWDCLKEGGGGAELYQASLITR